MWLRFVLNIVLILGAFEECSSENISTPSYDLCDFGPALTSQNGSIYATFGMDCSRIILAPKGYRIEFNITENTRIQEKEAMYVYDGATKYDNKNRASISRHRVTENYIAISTSNAVLIYVDKITSKLTNVEITYKMFRQPPERCLCLPVTHGETVCSFPSQFFRDDSLTKQCTVACGQHRFIVNRYFSHDFKMQCFMGDPERDLYNKGKWNAIGQFENFLDDQLITCARIFPATRLKLGYKFSYTNVSCAQMNETIYKNKIRQYISSLGSVANFSQCFKHPNPQENINCFVDSVNITCKPNGRSAELILTVRDNIINSTNETVAYQRYFRLFSAYYPDIVSKQYLIEFITKNLTVNGTKATGFSYVYPRRPIEDCPNNAAYKVDFANGRYGCLKCPPNFYKQETVLFPCQECQNGTRRNKDEATCVQGPRNYPNPSQKYCKHTCDLGKYFNTNSSICEWCPYGTYQNSTTTFDPECTPCPDSLTTAFIGARNISECINLCPAGYYLKYTKCVQCDVGYYMPNASNRLPKCYKCQNGYTTLGIGTVDGCVEKCTVGKYFNMTLRNCALCPNNTYQDEINYTNTRNCKKCPVNTTTASTGSTMLSDCLGPCTSGQYIDIGLKKCSPCPLNTYQDEGQHVSFSCKTCGKYKITLQTASSNISECIYTCSKGKFFNLTSKLCEGCPINMYQDELGKETCKSCQGKTFTLKTGSEVCINPCHSGEFLNKSVEKCQNCTQGFYQNISEYTLDICHPCPMDFYSDKSGQKNCTACQDGSITLITGATSETECIETCQPGYFLNKTVRSCLKCLKGFYQDKTGYRDDFCTKCRSANLTTLETGAKSAEECVGFCASSPCFNGAECFNVDNDFNCSCSAFLIGKQCETITDRNISDSMEITIRFPSLIWNENLKSPESGEFKQLAWRIENGIRAEFENDATFRTAKVVEFRSGSVVSDVEFTYVGGVSFVTPADTLTTAVADGTLGDLTVDTNSVNITNYTCSQPLGMVNRRIPDSAITSGVTRNYHAPKNARLHNPGPGWAPLYLSGDDVYLQVDFLEEVWLTGIATQGSSYHDGSWLQTFYFRTSSNGNDWSYYVGDSVLRHVFIANSDVDTVVHNTLPYPVKTRYVRMFEYHFKVWISYRVEFYGCPIPKTVPLPTLTPPTTNTPTLSKSSTHPSNQSTAFTEPTNKMTTLSTNKPTLPLGSTAITLDDDDDDDDGDNAGLIVGVVLGVFALCIIVVAVVVWWMKRTKHSRSFGSVNAMQLKETN